MSDALNLGNIFQTLNKLVVFKEKNKKTVCVLYPTNEGLKKFGIDGLIKKDIPEKAKYRIIEAGHINVYRPHPKLWFFIDLYFRLFN